MNGSQPGGNGCGGAQTRGQSEILGVVLLLGMVIAIGATVVFFGVAALESMESQTVRESVHDSLDSTIATLNTVAAGDDVHDLPLDVQEADVDIVTDRDHIGVIWYADGDEPAAGSIDPAANPDCHWQIDDIGYIEYIYDDRAAYLQSGGVWERTGGGVRTHTSPPVSMVGETAGDMELTMEVMSIEGDDIDPRRATAWRGDSNTEAFPMPSGCGEPNIYLEIDSVVADGWYQHFESIGLDDVDNVTVEYHESEGVVTVYAEDFATPSDVLLVHDDHGLDRADHVVWGQAMHIETEYKWTGSNVAGLDTEIWVEIAGEQFGPSPEDGGPVPISESLDRGQTHNITFIIPGEQGGNVDIGYTDLLAPGYEHEYTIHSEDDEIDQAGTFYYGTEGIHLNVTEPRVDGSDANNPLSPVNASEEFVNVTASVHNIGTENVTAADITLTLEPDLDIDHDWYEPDVQQIDRAYGEVADVTWTLNRSQLVTAPHEFRITTDDDETHGHFDVYRGVAAEETEVFVDPNAQINATVAGTEMSDATSSAAGTHRVGYPIPDVTDGQFTTAGSGLSYSFDAPDPSSEDDEMEPAPTGGWIDPDGSSPTAVETGCVLGWCDYEWQWDVDELVWDDDEGYELTWSHQGGDWGFDGPVESEVVPEGETDRLLAEPEDREQRYVHWLPGSTTLITQPVTDENEPVGEPTPVQGVDWHDENLNIQETPRPIYEHSFTTDERVSIQMEASSHVHGSGGDWCGNYPTERSYEIRSGTVYENEYCPGNGPVSGGDLVNLQVDTETEETNVRVLEDGDQMPEIYSGNEYQWDVDELLQRDGVDVTVDESGTLHMDETEFVFVFTLTHHPEQHNQNPTVGEDISPEEYWELAFEQDGDPNFNDMIVHVDITPGDDPESVGIDGSFDGGAGEPVSAGSGSSSGEDVDESSETDIDVGNDEIIIG